MKRFIKSQATSFLASSLDFVITIILVEMCKLHEEYALVAGNLSGGILHFSLSRIWVFQAREEMLRSQFVRYWMVWILNFALNFAAVILLIRLGNVHYLIAKIGVALLLSMSFNYFMNRKYVFRQ